MKTTNLTRNKSWFITKDLGVCNDCENATPEQIEEIKKTHPHKFRMYDDDGELYYEGYSNDDSSFDPLDDFGMPNAGCADIRYKNKNNEFETL